MTSADVAEIARIAQRQANVILARSPEILFAGKLLKEPSGALLGLAEGEEWWA